MFDDDLSDEEDPPEKRSKRDPLEDRTAESLGELLDENATISKQQTWEEKGTVKSGKGKRKFKSRNSKKKKSSILSRKK